MPNLSTWALNHRPLVRYLIAVLLLGGVFSYFGLGQDEDPPFTFRAMVVRSYWPGATAQQMAEQVSDKIEKKLQEVPYADKIRTYTKPGEMLTILQLRDSAPPKDVANSFYTTRKTIGDMKQDLPAGVLGPFFNDDFGDVYGVMFAFSADGYNYAQLKEYVEQTRQQLLRVKDVAKVQLFGVQDEKVFLDFNHQRLAQQGVDVTAVLAQITGQLDVAPSGAITTTSSNIPVRVSGQTNAVATLEAMPIKVGTTTVRLGDLAKVKRGFVEPTQQKIRQNGKDIILLGVSMAKGGDIIALGKSLAVAETKIEAGLPIGIEMDKVQDQPRVVAGSVNEFLRTLVEAVVIVLVVSFLALGLHKNESPTRRWYAPFVLDWRPGLVVGLTIPLVLAMTFLVMGMTNTNLHKISLGALIIALGLLVDDAIIAVEMMVRKLEEGMGKFEAATFAYKATAFPMLTGTLITAVGFLPIAMAKSAAGEYTFTIFSVTAMALVLSWIAAVIFTPYLGFLILKDRVQVTADMASSGADNHSHHDVFNTPALNLLRRMVTWCVTHPWKTIAATVLAFALGIVGMGKVEQQFFPDSSRLEVLVDVWLPEGSSYDRTDAEVRKLEGWLAKQPEAVSYTSNIGAGRQRYVMTLDQIFPQSNVAQIIVIPKDLPSRDVLRARLEQAFKTEFTGVRGRAKLLPNGPPVNYPVQFRVEGPDAVVARGIADKVKAVVEKNEHTLGVNDNWNESIASVKLNIDQEQARALGVTSKSIAQATATLGGGAPVATFRDGDKQIDIVMRLYAGDAKAHVAKNHRLDELTQLNVFTNTELVFEPGVMWRENRNYAITVNADIKGNIQAPTVTAQIDPLLTPIRAAMPVGYNISVAGAQEESSKGQASIAAGVPVMLFITFTLLMLQLKSFSRSLLVFLTGPFGIIGAAGALLMFNRPFGFVALLGVIALMGMIQRNSVILIDQIEQQISDGDAPWRAIVDSAVRRARPIVLTAAAAILAMIPLTRSVFWGPMAVAIMGGLVVATFLTLLSLPAMYAAWFKVKVTE